MKEGNKWIKTAKEMLKEKKMNTQKWMDNKKREKSKIQKWAKT